MHAEPTQCLSSIASESGRSATCTDVDDTTSSPTGADGKDAALGEYTQGEANGAPPADSCSGEVLSGGESGVQIRDAGCHSASSHSHPTVTSLRRPCAPAGYASCTSSSTHSLGVAACDDDGRCVGALRAQLRASATELMADSRLESQDPWDQKSQGQGAAMASGGSSSSSSRRPSSEHHPRPSCSSCSCASEAQSEAPSCHGFGAEVPSNGCLQEIHSVLHGVLLELQQLKAGQRLANRQGDVAA